jgi:hypothetical protein
MKLALMVLASANVPFEKEPAKTVIRWLAPFLVEPEE